MYEKLDDVKSSAILKTVLNNHVLFNIPELEHFDLETVRVSKKVVGAIDIFFITGVPQQWAYCFKGNVYFYTNVMDATSSIEISLRGANPFESSLRPLMLELHKED